MTHPYFTARARAWMARAGARPQDTDALARWAQTARLADLDDRGVIIGRDGTLVAETRRRRGHYHVAPGDMARLGLTTGSTELGAALGAIRRHVGQDVAHAAYWEVSCGAGRLIPEVADTTATTTAEGCEDR